MARRVKLLVVAFDLSGGGAERELCNLLRLLPRSQFEIRLCLWRRTRAYELPDEVPVDVLDEGGNRGALTIVWRLRGLLSVFRPDVVYSQLAFVSLVTGLALLAQRSRARWVCRMAGNPYWEIKPPLLSLVRRIFRRANIVAGCSQGVSEAITAHLRIPPQRVQTLPNLVDVEAIRAAALATQAVPRAPGRFTIAHAGRLTHQKNQQMLLDALSCLRGAPVELWILGEGALQQVLTQHAASIGVSGHVRWLGFQLNPFAHFRAADCFALTSEHEGLPNVLIEAMLCDVAVVSTRCPYGPEELVEDGVTGLLTPVGDAQAFAVALRSLLEDESLRRRLASQAVKRITQQFRTESVYPRYEAVLGEGFITRA